MRLIVLDMSPKELSETDPPMSSLYVWNITSVRTINNFRARIRRYDYRSTLTII